MEYYQQLGDEGKVVDALLLEPGANMEYFTGVKWGLSERPFLYLILSNMTSLWICPAFEVRKATEVGTTTF